MDTPSRIQPLPRFVNPDLPSLFMLMDSEDSTMGPFCRDDAVHETDGALVFHEDGWLPMRIGVLRQEGNCIDVYPEGKLRVVAVD